MSKTNDVKTDATGPNPEYIRNLFDSISDNYDRANHVITLGLLKSWRKKLVKISGAQPGDAVLDCATGTGDLAISFKQVVGKKGFVLGSDFSEGMLELAPKKAKKLKLDIQFEVADVMNLPYEKHRFNVVSIGYGIRNVQNPVKGLKEMARVTKPGGSVMILETGEVNNPIMRPLIRTYFEYIVPTLGAMANKNKSAYQYLNKSSGQFPCGEDFVNLAMNTHCFDNIEYFPLMGGASYIYKAKVKS